MLTEDSKVGELIMSKIKRTIKRTITFCAPVALNRISLSAEDARAILTDWCPCPTGTCEAENAVELTYDLQIIVPAYNVEKYIGDCLRSIAAQATHYRCLAVIVNDGSTDGTAAAIDQITANWDGQIAIEVFTQRNSGPSEARNAAIRKLRGEYVMFLDADDVLPVDAVENMLNAAHKTNADILQGGWFDFFESPANVTSEHILQEEGVLSDNRGVFSGFPWGKLYKYTVLKRFQFPSGFWFEDTPVSFILAAMPYRFAAIKDVVYGYRQNLSGITARTVSSRKSVESYWITERCLAEFPSFGLSYDQRAYTYLLRQSVTNWNRTRKQPRRIRQALFILTGELMTAFFKDFNTDVPELRKIEKAIRDRRFLQYEMLMLGK